MRLSMIVELDDSGKVTVESWRMLDAKNLDLGADSAALVRELQRLGGADAVARAIAKSSVDTVRVIQAAKERR